VDRIADTYATADRSDGFIARSQRDMENWSHSWGDYVCPNFLDPVLHSKVAQTLSVWKDSESVFAFSYADMHADGMKLRKEWFREAEYPSYAAWWVDDDYLPTFAEATVRLERLHAEGATPFAFSFKHAFDSSGNPTVLDQEAVRDKIRKNQQRKP
jgi:hypothetical protein